MIVYVCDEALRDKLAASGAKTIQKTKDVRGGDIWTMEVGKLTFNLSDDRFRGKFVVADKPRLFF